MSTPPRPSLVFEEWLVMGGLSDSSYLHTYRTRAIMEPSPIFAVPAFQSTSFCVQPMLAVPGSSPDSRDVPFIYITAFLIVFRDPCPCRAVVPRSDNVDPEDGVHCEQGKSRVKVLVRGRCYSLPTFGPQESEYSPVSVVIPLRTGCSQICKPTDSPGRDSSVGRAID